jgi:hypothetical protein
MPAIRDGVHCSSFIYTRIFKKNLFIYFIVEILYFFILLLPLAIVGIDHSEDNKNWVVFSTLFLQNNII